MTTTGENLTHEPRAAGEATRPTPRTPEPRARRGPWVAAIVLGAVLAAMLTGGAVASRYEARLGQMARETAAVRERLRHSEAALREEVALYRGVVDLLHDPATRVLELRGAGPSPEASGRLVWREPAGSYLVVTNLPQPPAGQAYELWALGGATPRPAGVFKVDASGRAIHRVEPGLGPALQIAVTLEPETGVPVPTGPTVLASR